MALTKITGGMIDPTAITPSAVSDQVNSSTGYFQLPTGTTAQRDPAPASGYFRFNSDTNSFEGYSSSSWGSVGGGATGGGNDAVFVENDQAVTTDYTIPVGKNASSVGPIEVPSGVAITVSSGSRWVIL